MKSNNFPKSFSLAIFIFLWPPSSNNLRTFPNFPSIRFQVQTGIFLHYCKVYRGKDFIIPPEHSSSFVNVEIGAYLLISITRADRNLVLSQVFPTRSNVGSCRHSCIILSRSQFRWNIERLTSPKGDILILFSLARVLCIPIFMCYLEITFVFVHHTLRLLSFYGILGCKRVKCWVSAIVF